jgi:hypothetical protein
MDRSKHSRPARELKSPYAVMGDECWDVCICGNPMDRPVSRSWPAEGRMTGSAAMYTGKRYKKIHLLTQPQPANDLLIASAVLAR